jgi:hypothetical protein
VLETMLHVGQMNAYSIPSAMSAMSLISTCAMNLIRDVQDGQRG